MKPSLRPSLRQLLQENVVFFTGFLVYLLLCVILLDWIIQGEEIFFFSERRSFLGDRFFMYFTKMGEGVAFIGALILLLFFRYRTALSLPLLGLAVSIVSNLTKTWFGHQRPSLYFRNLGILDQVNIVEGVHLNGGANSFPSGHTMAAFALYAYLAFCLPYKRVSGAVFITFAALVGISRIYLVQHFLKDIFLGAVLGVLLALFFYYVQLSWPKGERWKEGIWSWLLVIWRK